jgi:hypothetical protein
MRRSITVILFVALSSSCVSARPPAAAAPPQRTAEIPRIEPQKERPSAAQAEVSAPVASPPILDSIEEQRRADEQREQKEDAALRQAEELFQKFIEKAGNDPAYAEAVERSRERIADIEEILRFRAQGRLERARAERAE